MQHTLFLLLALSALAAACREDEDCLNDYTAFYKAHWPRVKQFYHEIPYNKSNTCTHLYDWEYTRDTTMSLMRIVPFVSDCAGGIISNFVLANSSWMDDGRLQCCNWTYYERANVFRPKLIEKANRAITECCKVDQQYWILIGVIVFCTMAQIAIGAVIALCIRCKRERCSADPVYPSDNNMV